MVARRERAALFCARVALDTRASGRSSSSLAGARESVPTDAEYTGSVLLIITGPCLDPGEVTRLLRIRPFQSWRRGDARTIRAVRLDSAREGLWKGRPPASVRTRLIEVQLNWWASRLAPSASRILRLQRQGCYCRLSWFMTTDATVSIVLPNNLQRALSKLNLHWEFSVFAHRNAHDGRAS